MTHFPILETDRLLLHQLTLDDADALYRYFSLDEVTRYYDLESFTEQSQAVALIETWNSSYELGLGIRWGITLKDTSETIGTIGYHSWEKEHFKSEIGYELSPSHWRKGYMSEAIAAILPYGFEIMGLNRIEAMIDPANDDSRRLLEKAGLTEEGLLRDYYLEKSQFVDAVIFSLLKREYRIRLGEGTV
ncbi:GNAT family N-acetyltransferase [Paenibacillus gorillae]|uniref:GNAT family N-acetyltransferase n=1 Tax=Paenibacillus gorillae TaxID=1243662 RepID=UPI0004B0F674|nr:GNAT family protein [Paenibacillus gorillae]